MCYAPVPATAKVFRQVPVFKIIAKFKADADSVCFVVYFVFVIYSPLIVIKLSFAQFPSRLFKI